MEQLLVNNLNPMLSVDMSGTVLYSNTASEPILHEWCVKVGEKLPSNILDFVQRAISWNNPEKMQVKVRNKMYFVAFYPLPEKECVNIFGFDISSQDEKEMYKIEVCEQIQLQDKELHVSNEELNKTGLLTLAENSLDLIIRFDRHNFCLYANPTAMEFCTISLVEKFRGCSKDDTIGKSNLKVQIDPQMAKLSEKQRAKVFASGKPESIEFHYVSPQGREYYFDTKIAPESINGEISSVLVISRDITAIKEYETKLSETLGNLEKLVKERTDELKEAYDLLKKSEKGLAEAQKMAHIGNWDWNLITNKFYFSDELYRIFGLNPYELDVSSLDEVFPYIHPQDRDYVKNSILEALNGKAYDAIDFRIILTDGMERTVHTQGEVIFNEKNLPVQLRGTVQDITELKQMDKALCESEQKYRNIVETANEGIAIIDSKGIVTYANRKLWEHLGYCMEEIINKSACDFIEDATEFNSRLKDISLGDTDKFEFKAIRKDGSKLWVHVNLKSLFNEKGEYSGTLGMFMDITKRKEAEESLAKIDNLRKQELHHRMKNNLQVISCLLDLQAEQFKGKKNMKIKEVLDAFKESQDRVLSMALIHEELYKAGDIDKLNFSQYIEELADNLFLSYRLKNSETIFKKYIEDSIFFDIDTAIPLGIIINELISNSLKYAFQGRNNGEIHVKLSIDESRKCKNSSCKSASYVLSVSDNGIGISEDLDIENLDSLGLQLVTSLIDQLGGELELKRKIGTEFIIKFRVKEKNN